MRFNNNHKIQAITLQALTVMSLLVSVTCVEKRPEIEAQGSNLEDLIAIQKVDGLKCKLTTSKAPLVKTNFSEADQVTTGDSGFKFYDIMDFKSDCPYLEENKEVLEFRGAPSTTYKIVFKVEPNHFVAYKKVKKKDLSHYEMPYSTRVKGYYLVPIGGFSIGSFYNTEFQKN